MIVIFDLILFDLIISKAFNILISLLFENVEYLITLSKQIVFNHSRELYRTLYLTKIIHEIECVKFIIRIDWLVILVVVILFGYG